MTVDKPAFLCLDLQNTGSIELSDTVVAIGNFDGMHTGHQCVLQTAIDIARDKGLNCYALSFEPHPRTLFRPDSPVFRLTPEADKARVMKAFGLDGLLVLPFTKELANTSAEDFINQHLIGAAGVRHVVTGFNFHFGKERKGSPEFLAESGKTLGFDVTIVEAQDDEEGELVSSSRIRRLLGEGDCVAASELLGHRWSVSGEVIKGQQIGRTLGYPTANIKLPASHHLAHGIYAVKLRRQDGSLHDGVASYGRRPTFDEGEALLETYVFDFSDDLYGEEISVSLFEYLRGEEKFDHVEDLIKQMDRDASLARDILCACEPLSKLDQKLNFEQA